MNTLLKEKNVSFVEKVNTWQEAIKVSLKNLVEQGYCEARYIDGVFANTEKYGPYYVLGNYIALIHASPDQGAIETQASITVLKEAIQFKEGGEDVRILVGLVGKDAQTHLQLLQKLSAIFDAKGEIQKILDATSTQEVYKIFHGADV